MAGRLKEKGLSINFRLQISKCINKLPLFCILISALCYFGCGTPYGIYHRVDKGQTLASIAKAYDVPQQELISINRLKEPVTLREGDAVFIPGASIEKVFEAHKDDEVPPSTSQLPIPPAKAKGKQQVAYIPQTKDYKEYKETTKVDKGKFSWPVSGRVISEFGNRNGERHQGIDIKADEGTPVKAAEAGKVIYNGNGLNGYGNLIIIKHEGTYFTVYAHNKANVAAEGSIVEKGEVIAEVGATGRATTPHLHFEIRKNKVSVDPNLYLP